MKGWVKPMLVIHGDNIRQDVRFFSLPNIPTPSNCRSKYVLFSPHKGPGNRAETYVKL